MISKEAAYTIVEDLVTRFDEQIASYKKTDYNETLSRDFIDPFFITLAIPLKIDNTLRFSDKICKKRQ
jgi:hypothetical protein